MSGPSLVQSEADLRPLSDDELRHWRSGPARQQPDWIDPQAAAEAFRLLADSLPLVGAEEITALQQLLGAAALGEVRVLQAGACAEDLAHATAPHVAAEVRLLRTLAQAMKGDRPVLAVGRIAGQFAKPRSRATESVGAAELPVFRGLLVNEPAATASARKHRAERMVACHRSAAITMELLRADTWSPSAERVWTSHEALVLDYEVPQLRRRGDGSLLLTSTHWPWIGDRTRDPDGAHVRLLAAVANPVACKVGPTLGVDELLQLCELLDPLRVPGRLTLISRLGTETTARHLPDLVGKVRAAGHPVLWLCDPMHGNTLTAPSGRKVRTLTAITTEIAEFHSAVTAAGGVPAGLHLEATSEPVTECAWDADEIPRLSPEDYTSLCDPRLNTEQAIAVARRWAAAEGAAQ